MNVMGLEAIFPRPRLSKSSQEHKKYPYLLRDLQIGHPDHVWCSDLTYIRMAHGFIYLMVIMDWFSRYVISRAVSLT
jgi:putative transposase